MKLRKMLLTFGALCLLLACNTKKNTNNTNCDNTITTRVENLKQAFEQRNYPCFFRQFPNTYKELIEFYGYDDSTGARPLYDYYHSHINYLFEYDGKLIDEAFVIKVYGIAKNGIWDADCVGLFQLNLIELIERNPVVILQVLSKQPAKDITGFWFFVFDGAEIFDLQNKERFDMIYNKIDSLDKKQGLILKNEFKKMYPPPMVAKRVRSSNLTMCVTSITARKKCQRTARPSTMDTSMSTMPTAFITCGNQWSER